MSVIKDTKVCDGCGAVVHVFHETDNGKDYCFSCRPKRMTLLQLVEWLAKGNGFICQQNKPYATHLDFNCKTPFGFMGKELQWHDEIPYSEHEWVIRNFDDTKNQRYWNIPTEFIYNRDCK